MAAESKPDTVVVRGPILYRLLKHVLRERDEYVRLFGQTVPHRAPTNEDSVDRAAWLDADSLTLLARLVRLRWPGRDDLLHACVIDVYFMHAVRLTGYMLDWLWLSPAMIERVLDLRTTHAASGQQQLYVYPIAAPAGLAASQDETRGGRAAAVPQVLYNCVELLAFNIERLLIAVVAPPHWRLMNPSCVRTTTRLRTAAPPESCSAAMTVVDGEVTRASSELVNEYRTARGNGTYARQLRIPHYSATSMTVEQLHTRLKRRSQTLMIRVTSMAAGRHAWCNILSSRDRRSFGHRFYTQHKKNANRNASNTVTERRIRACDDPNAYTLHAKELPTDDYCPRLARYELFLTSLTFATVPQLLRIGELLDRVVERAPQAVHDLEFIQYESTLAQAGHARFRTRTLRLNEEGCTCRTKCFGPVGDRPRLERRLYDVQIRLHCSHKICGLCRWSPSVENTTSEKPRVCLSGTNPSMESCSWDGSSSYKYVDMYRLDTEFTADGTLAIRYAQQAYATNAVSFMDELQGVAKSGRAGRLYTMCFSKRTCKQRLVQPIPSVRANTPVRSCADRRHWYRCHECSPDKDYGAVANLALMDDDRDTCCYRYVNGQLGKESKSSYPVTLLRMCRGCKAALLCRHVRQTLAKNAGTDDELAPSYCKRVKIIIEAQRRLLTEPELWPSSSDPCR